MAGSEEVIFMEEVHGTRKVVRKEAGRASGGSDQPVIATEEAENLSIVVQVEEISGSTRSMKERFKSLMDTEDDNTTTNTRIQKVPFMLRNTKDFEKYFEPRVISIGPYHYGKVKLKPAESLKLKFAKKFISDSGKSIEFLHNKIFQEIKKLRNCYDEEPTKKYDDEALAWMLFVDGCSALQYIHCDVKDKSDDLLKDHRVIFLHQDLFLLENQLPFLVLELLMRGGFRNNNGMEVIEKFIQRTINMILYKEEREHQRQQPPPMEERQQQQQPPPTEERQQQQQQQPPMEGRPPHLLELLRKRLIDQPRQKLRDKICKPKDLKKKAVSFRNVMELTAVGIHLKPSDTNCLNNVSFKSHFFYGDLTLPPIIVDDSTRTKFLNLIAYEISEGVDLEVTSYICFLDSLVDHPEDVKQLRAAGIVHNFLGSDEEVAKLFNEITTDLPSSYIYRDVKGEIQKHYDDRWKCWMTQVINDHFSSPWTIIAFTGAVFVILLTVVQTIFAIRDGIPWKRGRSG